MGKIITDKYGELFRFKTAGVLLIRIIGIAISFLLTIILTRKLGVDEFGYFMWIMSIVSILVTISSFGLDNAILNFLPKYKIRKQFSKFYGFYEMSKKLLGLNCIIIISFFCLVIFYLLLNDDIRTAILFGSALLLFPSISFLKIYISFLRAMESILFGLSINLIFRPIFFIMLIYIFSQIFDEKIKAYQAVLMNASVFVLMIVIIFARIPISFPSQKNIIPEPIQKVWLFTAFNLFIINCMQTIIGATDKIMIGILLDIDQVSFYSIAQRISSFVGFGLSSINILLAPIISKLYAAGQLVKLQGLLNKIARINLLSGLIISVVLIYFGKNILSLFGDYYSNSYNLLLIMICGHLFHCICGPVTYLMIMTDFQSQVVKVFGILAIVNVILHLLLIPSYGILGSAITYTAIMFLWNLVLLIFIYRKIGLNPSIIKK